MTSSFPVNNHPDSLGVKCIGIIINYTMKILDGGEKVGQIPKLWDGEAANRICKILLR